MDKKPRKFTAPTFGLLFYLLATTHVSATVWDCFWGGSNEQTTYTAPYVRGTGNVTLAQVPQPQMNLGAPQPAIPIQSSPGSYSMTVPQASIPTITVPTGPVGSVGMPATQPMQTAASGLPQLPPGTEIVYVLPPENRGKEECIDGTPGTPAVASKVVPPGTPGAIPVAIREVTVRRPKVERRLTYSPITTKTETLVKVVDPRTGRIVRTFCKNDEEKSSLPWPHVKETVTYETVTVKVGTPVSLNPSASTAGNTVIRGAAPAPVPHQSRYPDWMSSSPMDGNSQRTMILP